MTNLAALKKKNRKKNSLTKRKFMKNIQIIAPLTKMEMMISIMMMKILIWKINILIFIEVIAI